MTAERYTTNKKESVFDSRVFKGGLVAVAIGAILGIGVVVEIGAIVAGTGATWRWINRKKDGQ